MSRTSDSSDPFPWASEIVEQACRVIDAEWQRAVRAFDEADIVADQARQLVEGLEAVVAAGRRAHRPSGSQHSPDLVDAVEELRDLVVGLAPIVMATGWRAARNLGVRFPERFPGDEEEIIDAVPLEPDVATTQESPGEPTSGSTAEPKARPESKTEAESKAESKKGKSKGKSKGKAKPKKGKSKKVEAKSKKGKAKKGKAEKVEAKSKGRGKGKAQAERGEGRKGA